MLKLCALINRKTLLQINFNPLTVTKLNAEKNFELNHVKIKFVIYLYKQLVSNFKAKTVILCH